MKFAAAYLLACLGAEQAAAAAAAEEGAVPAPAPAAVPTKDDVRRILGSVGAEADEDRLDLLFALMDGKDVAELVAAGREQLAYAPSGAAAVAAPGAAGGGAGEEEEDKAKEEEAAKKKKEEVVEEEDEENIFSLFDD